MTETFDLGTQRKDLYKAILLLRRLNPDEFAEAWCEAKGRAKAGMPLHTTEDGLVLSCQVHYARMVFLRDVRVYRQSPDYRRSQFHVLTTCAP